MAHYLLNTTQLSTTKYFEVCFDDMKLITFLFIDPDLLLTLTHSSISFLLRMKFGTTSSESRQNYYGAYTNLIGHCIIYKMYKIKSV